MNKKEILKLKIPSGDIVNFNHGWIKHYETLIFTDNSDLSNAAFSCSWGQFKKLYKAGATFHGREAKLETFTMHLNRSLDIPAYEYTGDIATIYDLSQGLERVKHVANDPQNDILWEQHIFLHLGPVSHIGGVNKYRLSYYRLAAQVACDPIDIILSDNTFNVLAQLFPSKVYLKATNDGFAFTDGDCEVYFPDSQIDWPNYNRGLERSQDHKPYLILDSKAIKNVLKVAKYPNEIRIDRVDNEHVKLSDIKNHNEDVILPAIVGEAFQPYGIQKRFLVDLLKLYPDVLKLEYSPTTQAFVIDDNVEIHLVMPINVKKEA